MFIRKIWSLGKGLSADIREDCLRAQYFERVSDLLTPITINQPNQDQYSAVNCWVHQRNQLIFNAAGGNQQIGLGNQSGENKGPGSLSMDKRQEVCFNQTHNHGFVSDLVGPLRLA